MIFDIILENIEEVKLLIVVKFLYFIEKMV